MSTAIVLSGGGAKGSFQVGALRFLYERRGVRPSIITGCSVGAINGAKLAEGEGLPTQGLRGLVRIWNGLRTNDDMFLREQWLTEVHPVVRETIEGSSGAGLDTSLLTGGDYAAWGDLAFLPQNVERAALAVAGAAVAEEVVRNLRLINSAEALYNLEPIARKLRGDAGRGIPRQLDPGLVQQWAAAGGRLRLAAVSLESGSLRYVDESGRLLERDNGTAVTVPTTSSPACAALEQGLDELLEQRRQEQEDLQAAAGSGKAAVAARIRALNAEIAQQNAALRECRRLNPPQRRPAVVDLATGVLASASIPGLFRAVSMEGETYVDGGVREVLPLQAAVDLGATTVYAIDASRPDVVPAGSYAGAGMFAIVGRALVDLAINEVARNDQNVVRHGAPRITGVQPSFDVHEMTTVEPGYLRVAMDYGYMRAVDVVAGNEREEARRQDWCDDALPVGAQEAGDEAWTWTSSAPPPCSGSRAHTATLRSGIHQHYFHGGMPMVVQAHDVLFAHVWLPSGALPVQVMLQWFDGSWDHRAYWGQSRIGWGEEGTASRRYMGPLPAADTWVRLEVPAERVGLEGRAVTGMAFTLHDGLAVWDVAGRRPGVVSRGVISSDAITRLRQQIRGEEQAYFAVPTDAVLQGLQAKKRQVRDLVRQRLLLGLEVPPHIEKAWTGWEWFAPPGLPEQPWRQVQAPRTVPPVCRPLEDAVEELEQEKAALQADLSTAAGSQKTFLISQIRRVQRRLTEQRAALEQCIVQNMPPPPLDPVRHGLLLQGSGPEIHVLYGGSRLWIRSMEDFDAMGFQAADVLRVPDEVLAGLPLDRPVDGTLLATKGDPKVYVMDGGSRRWVTSPAVLEREAAGWDNSWPHIRWVPGATLQAVPAGPDLV